MVTTTGNHSDLDVIFNLSDHDQFKKLGLIIFITEVGAAFFVYDSVLPVSAIPCVVHVASISKYDCTQGDTLHLLNLGGVLNITLLFLALTKLF
jgi:hypothetical protein